MRSILVRFNSSILVRNSWIFLIIEQIIITSDTLDIDNPPHHDICDGLL